LEVAVRLRDMVRRTIWAAGGVAAAKLILGLTVPLPDARVLTDFIARGGSPLVRLYNLFGGGALARGSAFALGIMPYVSARVAMLIAKRMTLEALPPSKEKWWTRGLTVSFSLIQSYGYAQFTQGLSGAVSQPGVAYTLQTMAMLTSVSTLVMLFAEEATAPESSETNPVLPREHATEVRSAVVERDPLYISHPTPLP
jgi:preprotein translocase subunit SecY